VVREVSNEEIETMDRQAQSTLEKLRLAIHGVTAPFSCAGTCLPEEPVTFIFRDQTRFEITPAKNAFEQKNELKPLLERCKPAPFGDGKKTRYDRNVRDALQLKAERGGFSIAGFGPESAGILKRIQRQSKEDRDPELPAAARLHSCDYCPWGYFGNESSEVDLYTFGLGCGIAGVAGSAFTMIGSTGPTSGQLYIVDTFLVVVFGGAASLIGTIASAFSISQTQSTLEFFMSGSMAKVLTLLAVVGILMLRPQGLFALKVRK